MRLSRLALQHYSGRTIYLLLVSYLHIGLFIYIGILIALTALGSFVAQRPDAISVLSTQGR